MCGILGGINCHATDFIEAKKKLYHRGPDDTGEFTYENLYLYHARLAIQDIENGQQPLTHNNLSIVFNGEIYNHLELRKRFGFICRTNSDTETLLHLYEKLGKDCLHFLDGMFAFAIVDTKKKILFLARDRAGEKPLYYYRTDNTFVFGSELNSLTAICNLDITLDHQVFYQYLRYSFTNSNTPYKNILELEAGSLILIDLSTLRMEIERWWNIEDYYQQTCDLKESDVLTRIDELLNDSIKDRLKNSDLEVGTFLSGGIDSGLVTAIASRYTDRLKTFTVSFNGQYDESELALLVAKKYNTEHTKIEISFNDLKNDLIKILTNYGEPFPDSSAIPSYYVAREAKKYLTVILNGDGADELFGGYRRYVPFRYYNLFRTGGGTQKTLKLLSSILPFPNNKKNNYNYIYRLIDLAGKNPIMSYLSSTSDIFEGYDKYLISTDNPFPDIQKYLNNLTESNFSGLKTIMCTDFKFLFCNDLLVKMDIATMANSLEGRTPFLSKKILEFAPTIADHYKIHGFKTKYLLRELSRKYLPSVITIQPKRGFEVPLKKWIDNDLKEVLHDYLSVAEFSRYFVRKDFIDSLVNGRVYLPPEKRAKMLWVLLVMEIWYINRNKRM